MHHHCDLTHNISVMEFLDFSRLGRKRWRKPSLSCCTMAGSTVTSSTAHQPSALHSLNTHRAQFEYPQGTVWIPTGHSLNTHRAQFEYPHDTIWISTGHSLNTHRAQSEYPQGTVWIPIGHSMITLPWLCSVNDEKWILCYRCTIVKTLQFI